MSWSNRCSSMALAVLGFWAQVPASAQSSAIEAAQAACSADLQQLCAGVQPGGGRMLACLKQHRDQVSPACKQAVVLPPAIAAVTAQSFNQHWKPLNRWQPVK
jgi:hypothetical protein